MHNYLTQLVEELEAVALNPPPPPYIVPPPHMADDLAMAELALTPFKPVSEWTGISPEVFPCMTALQGGQWEMVTDAIFKIFQAFSIDLVDVPPGFPPERLYEVLTTHWDHPVQFLPSSGFDLELCTGDDATCPYGEYCDHSGSDEEENVWGTGGFFNDDGTRIDPETIPVPGLCLRCQSYLIMDWDENLLCMMTRHDQINDPEFICHAFKEI